MLGETGTTQRTPDLSALVEEVVARPGWLAGNSIVFLVTGTGKRVAESYNGEQDLAPLLHLSVNTSGGSPPQISISQPADDIHVNEGDDLQLVASAIDLEDDDVTLTEFIQWTSDLAGNLGTGGSVTTNILAEGIHQVTASVVDSDGLSGVDSVTVNVDPPTNSRPTASIDTPDTGVFWAVGDEVQFFGSANDPEDGVLDETSLTWSVDIIHNEHTHVDFLSASGAAGQFTYPDHDDNIHLRLCLTASDSGAQTDTVCIDLLPRLINYTFDSDPSGLNLIYNGQSAATPFSVPVHEGSSRLISAPSPQGAFVFDQWSVDGPATQQILIGATDSNLIATYNSAPSVTIDTPVNDAIFDTNNSIQFVSTATDAESGNIAASVTWNSSLDGDFLETGSIVNQTLSAGIHVITAQVVDMEGLSANNKIIIYVTPSGGAVEIYDIQITNGDDDAEESTTGSVNIFSSDLEMIFDVTDQTVGMRFVGVPIKPGAVITNAWIQFTADEDSTVATNLSIRGEKVANAQPFLAQNFNLSGRQVTTQQIAWSPASWSEGEAGANQRTPNLAPILNEIVNVPGWVNGNALSMIVTGVGERVAESYNGTAAPVLHVEYSTMPPVTQAPDAVDDGTDVDPAYSTGVGQQLTVPNGAEDIVERNDDVGYPTSNVISFFGSNGPFSAGQQGTSFAEGELTVYADGSFSYTPYIDFFGIDFFEYVLYNGEGQDTASVYIEVLNETPLWISVDRSSDDAEEASDGNMDLTSSDLELTREFSNQQVGIRFNGLNIPQEATILEAYIQFQADETDSEQTILMIKAEDIGNAATFNNSVIDFDISNRTPTTAQAEWTVPVWNSVGAAGSDQATPDLSAIVQEVVGRNDWVQGNSIAFIITGSGKRVAESFNGTAPPMLHLIYSNQPPVRQAPDAVDDGTPTDPAYSTSVDLELSVPNGAEDIVERNDDIGFPAAQVVSFGATGVEFLAGQLGQSIDGGDLTVNADGSFSYTPSIDLGVDSFHYVLKNDEGEDTARVFIEILNEIPLWISVDRSSDDAEEEVSNGHIDLTSSDLELTRESSDQLIGIRFNGLTIPQGATIVEAYIQFQVDETDSEPTDLTLKAEDTGNAMTFSNTGFDISNRTPTTAQMQWSTVPAWNSIGAAGSEQATPDLSAIVQEVVNRGDWVSDNSIAFLISGSGKRVAESFNGTAPPTLHVIYSSVLPD